ncbi:hypothetical protein LshimejAT787_0212020 [Lyophyllum shimeji]|uniref:Uncharacterized protein n=1 Tax=Lyophyllum shimeji TaxID=47721 RepID=A0A9P3UJP2_LYOSH|nr:hypothetical protein LshimejAT787_0212020 [Lyophyllum shimeji]
MKGTSWRCRESGVNTIRQLTVRNASVAFLGNTNSEMLEPWRPSAIQSSATTHTVQRHCIKLRLMLEAQKEKARIRQMTAESMTPLSKAGYL